MNRDDILQLTEPVEKVYMDCSHRLCVNIARHMQNPAADEITTWQIRKLGEMNQVRAESIRIIAETTGSKEELIRTTLEKALGYSLEDVDKVLQAAAEAGKIQMASGETYLVSGRVRDLLEQTLAQANTDLNLVNTTMLDSTVANYKRMISQTALEETRILATQEYLNEATLETALGIDARSTAVTRAIENMVRDGITGFIDRAGHHWSAEGYVNMDVRTTVHNIMIEGQKARSADAGVSTFQISSHAGARPLCEPYQGKFYSWDGSSGILHDLDGNEYHYEGIGMTSYGEPAGIFGINCGHSPITFVDGFSIPRYEETEDKEENDRIYKISQQQRALERDVRGARTAVDALEAAGETSAAKRMTKIANQKLDKYKDFCRANDRTIRYDRLEVVAGKE